jgi:hypothetical protein
MSSTTTTPIFIVTAYRHGDPKNHAYRVHVGTDRDAAIAEAKDEHQGRGLKYGVEVVECPAEETVAYFPSNAEDRNATGPKESAERHAAQTIGDRILLAYHAQTRKDALKAVIVEKLGLPELPPWLKELCETELALSRRMMPDTPHPSIRDE